MDKNTTAQNQYDKICEAQRVLCEYCEKDNCEKCIVTLLCDQAYVEAVNETIEREAGE